MGLYSSSVFFSEIQVADLEIKSSHLSEEKIHLDRELAEKNGEIVWKDETIRSLEKRFEEMKKVVGSVTKIRPEPSLVTPIVPVQSKNPQEVSDDDADTIQVSKDSQNTREERKILSDSASKQAAASRQHSKSFSATRGPNNTDHKKKVRFGFDSSQSSSSDDAEVNALLAKVSYLFCYYLN